MLQSYENNLSNIIENYINDLFNENNEDIINLRRKDLAEMFDCVPSQINYVLRSRFSPERGYLIEIALKNLGGNSPENNAELLKKMLFTLIYEDENENGNED